MSSKKVSTNRVYVIKLNRELKLDRERQLKIGYFDLYTLSHGKERLTPGKGRVEVLKEQANEFIEMFGPTDLTDQILAL
jgi:hypothetical protein